MSLIRFIILALVMSFSVLVGNAQEIPITFNIESGSGPQGSTVCIDFDTEDFDQVSVMQFVIRFDPSVVQPICPPDLTSSCINEISTNSVSAANLNCTVIDEGFINFVWNDAIVGGVTLDPPCSAIFNFCFLLVGDPCDESEIVITESGNVQYEFIKINGQTGEEFDSRPIVNPGTITIDPDDYSLTTSICSTDDASDTGSITFSGSGGTPPYDWSISGTMASGSGLDDCERVTVDDLAAGEYTITFIDANNIVRNEVVTIQTNSDFPFIVDLQGNNPTCFDRFNGSVDVLNIQGGEAPFQYEWSTFEFEEGMLSDLGSGDYTLTITDANGCTTSNSVSLSVDTLKLSVQIISDPSCEENARDGIVSIFAEGGTPYANGGYDFDIDGLDETIYFGASGAPTNPFTPGNLPEGCFEVVASDDASIACFSDPLVFCLEAGAFSDLVMAVDTISCFGECDGAIDIQISSMGSYDITVTDPNGITVTELNTLNYNQDNLCGGTYDVMIEDLDADCVLDTFFIIVEPALLELTVLDSMGPGCGGGDGMIDLAINGGTPDYTILWNDGFDQTSRTNMIGGTYSITVTDGSGCVDSLEFTFADGGDIGLNAFVCNAVSCASFMDGSICAEVSVGGNFTYSWEDIDGNQVGTGEQIDGVGGGIYIVTATDGICADVDTVIVAPGETPAISIVQEDPTCADSNDGTLTASLTSGANPASFVWTEPPSTTILSQGAVLLDGVGTYNLNVTDANGCELDTLVTMNPISNPILVDITNIVENTCFSQCEGSATFTASGGSAGTGNYVFIISNLSMNVNPSGDQATVNELCGGQNWVIATDAVCSSDTFFFEIPDADPITLIEDQTTIAPPTCFGDDDGSITIAVEGGDPASYDIFWINEGVSGPSLNNLTSGSYIYTVTDGSNCVVQDTIELLEPDSLIVEVNPFTTVNIGCFSDSFGRIGLNVTGGNSGSLTYDWNPAVSTSSVAEKLGVGIYEVTVTDAKGCTAETSYEMTSADPIVAVLNAPEQPDCFGGTTCVGVVSATGGVGNNYTFTINNGPRIPLDTCINLFAGPYLITVFDSSGCSVDTSIELSQPEQIIVDLGDDITIELGTSSDPISASIVAEFNIDSIFWNPIDSLVCNTPDCQVVTFSPLETTNYTVTVIDENGCIGADDITVFVDLTRNVYFANVFSPNGDNQNDFFNLVTGSGVREVIYFRMFDRWGNMMHQQENYMPDDSQNRGWDGTFNNQELDAGVYIYIAEVLFDDGVRVVYKGDVTLVR